MHGWVFKYDHELPAMVRFLLAHRQHRAPPGFAYASWRASASVWGWRIKAGAVGHGFWRLDRATPTGFQASSPGGLLVTPPGGARSALVDGARVLPGRGAIAVPPGRHTVSLRPAATA
jgi:hypothetical protein